jgi:histidinol-phosphatase
VAARRAPDAYCPGVGSPDGWTLGEDLELAQRLAGAGAEVALGYFQGSNRVETKADGTPVGEADLAVDRLAVEGLRRWRPGDAILSEESGSQPGRADGDRRWIIDPIDGTAVFVAGAPHWGTHLALEQGGEIVVAVVSRPALGELWWAVRGRGAHRDRLPARWDRRGRGRRDPGEEGPESLRTSRAGRLAESRITGWDDYAGVPLAAFQAAGRWLEPDWVHQLGVVAGTADLVVMPGRVWDHAPYLLLLEEAGGRYRDRDGGRRLDLGTALYSNGHLDTEIESFLAEYGRS